MSLLDSQITPNQFVSFFFSLSSHRSTGYTVCEVQYSKEALSGSVLSHRQSEFPLWRAAVRPESSSLLSCQRQRRAWQCPDTVGTASVYSDSVSYLNSAIFMLTLPPLQAPGLAAGHEGVCTALFHSLRDGGGQRSHRESVERSSAGPVKRWLRLHH